MLTYIVIMAIDYLHNGYYMIKSKCSVKVISVTDGHENSSNDALV